MEALNLTPRRLWLGRDELPRRRKAIDVRYNRIGFCVLHPASLAGRPYRATTPDGPVDGTLPDLVAPQSIVEGLEVPLFPACSRLAVDVEPALRSTATFDGDLFEME